MSRALNAVARTVISVMGRSSALMVQASSGGFFLRRSLVASQLATDHPYRQQLFTGALKNAGFTELSDLRSD